MRSSNVSTIWNKNHALACSIVKKIRGANKETQAKMIKNITASYKKNEINEVDDKLMQEIGKVLDKELEEVQLRLNESIKQGHILFDYWEVRTSASIETWLERSGQDEDDCIDLNISNYREGFYDDLRRESRTYNEWLKQKKSLTDIRNTLLDDMKDEQYENRILFRNK